VASIQPSILATQPSKSTCCVRDKHSLVWVEKLRDTQELRLRTVSRISGRGWRAATTLLWEGGWRQSKPEAQRGMRRSQWGQANDLQWPAMSSNGQ
jgi:hypothetical protein